MSLESIQTASSNGSKLTPTDPAPCKIGAKITVAQCQKRLKAYPLRDAAGYLNPMFLPCVGCEMFDHKPKRRLKPKERERAARAWGALTFGRRR
jgi:hypothetical protein